MQQIWTEADYEKALARLDEIFDAAVGSPELEELERLVDEIMAYEKIRYPIDKPEGE